MRTAATILNIIRKRGQRQLPLSRVYRLLYQPDFSRLRQTCPKPRRINARYHLRNGGWDVTGKNR
jgi:hypothetical protein